MVAAVVAVLLLAGCSSGPDGSADTSASGSTPARTPSTAPASPATPSAGVRPEQFTGGDRSAFYRPPATVATAKPGTLLRYEPARFTVKGGTAWKVMYASRSLVGKPIAVTGVVIVPSGTAPAGGWKLVSVAHGTTGVADDCAPSYADVHGVPKTPFDSVGMTVRDLYRTLPESGYLAKGYVVAVTDFEGLGTPGIHPYLVGQSEGRSVVDAARAARQLPGVPVQQKYAIWGYSQGGHAAAWANDIAATWAPELHLVGSVAGAPPSELNLVMRALAITPREPRLFFVLVAGYAAAYPELKPSDILTPAGLEVLTHADDGCMGLTDALRGKALSTLVKPGFDQATAWQTRLGENNPGRPDRPRVRTPLLLLQSETDQTVPAFLTEVLFQRMCGLGQVVQRTIYRDGDDHVAAEQPAIRDGLPWIEGLWSGRTPARSSCPAT